MAEFEAKVRPGREATVIELHGLVDGNADEALGRAYDEARSGPAILLDFGDVSYINSTGIALIVGVLAKARTDHKTVRAYGLSEHYREIFQITRLADFMAIYEDEESAAADVAAAQA